ncbi:MAG: FCD domain-containing protein [Rhodobacteraceae bacterium]|nr:FCD domain-containing protein [Paracoccaceae bacterium]
MFGSAAVETCRSSEHDELLAALRSRDADAAAQVMRDHLVHIEAALDLGRARTEGVDLVTLFSA